MSSFLLFPALICFFISSCHSHHVKPSDFDVFNVLDFGAVGDGRAYDTLAFMRAWNVTCESLAPSPTLKIPHWKTFLLQPLTFSGGCRSRNINVMIEGNLVAPENPDSWECNDDNMDCRQWIVFNDLEGLSIHGGGTIDGRGKIWWDCFKQKKVCGSGSGRRPNAFMVSNSNGVIIYDLSFKDNPNVHIAIERSVAVKITNITITAPHDSPNTDGIHIQKATHVTIEETKIGTGDDCISIGTGSSHIIIQKVLCGPGHGISIGSLGKHGKYEMVENVYVREVGFMNTTNGARIKTWQGGKGYVKDVIFEQIMSWEAKHLIIIDQYYCDKARQCHNQTSAVEISNVIYKSIKGTSSSNDPIHLACSKSIPCKNIIIEDVWIMSSRHGRNISSYCINANGCQLGQVIPHVACLTH